MTAVMQHLKFVTGLEPPELNGKPWTFREQLANQTTDFYRPLVKKHSALTFEYSVLCTHLVHEYFDPLVNDAQITEQLITALMMAELLTEIYHHYLVVPREVVRLQKEQLIFRQLLSERGVMFNEFSAYDDEADTFTQLVRSYSRESNWYRLFAVRAKRVINACAPLAQSSKKFLQFVAILDKYAGPILAHLSWLFFVPRLSVNLFLLCKHVIPGTWMSQKEQDLGLSVRLDAQLQRRWFDIGNDSTWMIGGLLNCFVLVAPPLLPAAVIINFSLYIYDVVLAGVRAGIEISRFIKLQEYYNGIAEDMRTNNAPPEELAEIARFQHHLQERIYFEQKRLMISVVTTISLAAAVGLFTFFPLAGAIMILTITVMSFIATKIVDSQRPSSSVEPLIKPEPSLLRSLSMFRPPLEASPLTEKPHSNSSTPVAV